jgi:uncharacterized membrane protein
MGADMSGFWRGMLAGAAGTTALNAVTYLDMAGRGRPASQVPTQSVQTIANRIQVPVPGRGAERDHRVEGLAALGGIATGVGIGGVFGWLHDRGLRLGVLGSVVIGGSAMAATDASMVRLGISDPQEWTTVDWASDVLPHLAYGCVTQACLTATDHSVDARPARPSTIGRAALAGFATGGRSSAGLAAVAMTKPKRSAISATRRRQVARATAALLATTEVIVDKRPTTPPRTDPVGLLSRQAAAATVGVAVARRAGENPALPTAAASLAAAGGAAVGLWWRSVQADLSGLTPLKAALIEDAVVATIAAIALSRT